VKFFTKSQTSAAKLLSTFHSVRGFRSSGARSSRLNRIGYSSEHCAVVQSVKVSQCAAQQAHTLQKHSDLVHLNTLPPPTPLHPATRGEAPSPSFPFSRHLSLLYSVSSTFASPRHARPAPKTPPLCCPNSHFLSPRMIPVPETLAIYPHDTKPLPYPPLPNNQNYSTHE